MESEVLAGHRGLLRPLPLFVDDLMYALPRHFEVLRKPRLIALGQAVSVQQIADSDAKPLGAFWIPLGHGWSVSVLH